jgi:hypothetical protein
MKLHVEVQTRQRVQKNELISFTKECYNLDSSGVKPHTYVYRYFDFCSSVGEYLEQAKTPSFTNFVILLLCNYMHTKYPQNIIQRRDKFEWRNYVIPGLSC